MIRHLLRDRRGSLATASAFSLPVLLCAAGVAVDLGYLANREDALQLAADSAALAGAREVLDHEPDAEVISVTQNYIRTNFENDAEARVVVDRAKSQVSVEAYHDHALFFGGFLGLPKTSRVSVKATAALSRTNPCIIALDPNAAKGIELRGASSIEAPDCQVWSNSQEAESFFANGGMQLKLQSKRTCAVGGVVVSGPFKLDPYPEAGCSPVPDPYDSFSYRMGQPCDFSAAEYEGSAVPLTLSPGVYCGGLQIESRTTLLLPGIYEFRNGPLRVSGNTSLDVLAGAGVSLVFTGSSPGFSLEGSTKAKLIAPLSGPFKDLAIVSLQSGATSRTSSITGAAELKLATGSMYLPGHYLSMQGNSKLKLKGSSGRLIVGSMGVLGGMQGNPEIQVAYDSDTSGEQVLLVE